MSRFSVPGLRAVLLVPAMMIHEAQAAPSAAEIAQRAVDIQEIQNVMGFHVWYHAHYMNDVELDEVWVRTKPYVDTAVWAQNSDYWQGVDKIRAYYGPKVDQKKQAGGFQFHTLTSPIIEVARDRKTAKGVWYTPGMVGGYPRGSWLWERYGVDFVNENGQWKIWHLHVYTDFGAPVEVGSGMGPPGGGPGGPGGQGGAGVSSGPPVAGAPVPGAAPSAERFGMEGGVGAPPPGGPGGPPGAGPPGPRVESSYKAKIGYRELGANSYPVLVPRPPEPYNTFSETWSYADPEEYARALKAIGAK